MKHIYSILFCLFLVAQLSTAQYMIEYHQDGSDIKFTAGAWDGEQLIVVGTIGNDILCAAFSEDGIITDSKRISVESGTTLTVPKSIIVDSEGYLVIAGYQWFGSETAAHAFVFKYQFETDYLVWFKTYLNTGSVFTKIIEQNPGGDYVVCGQNGHPDDQSAVLLKFDRISGDYSVVNNATHHPGSDTWWSVTTDGTDYYTAGRMQFYGGGVDKMRPVISKIQDDGDYEYILTYLRDEDEDARLYTPDITYKDGYIYMLVHGDGNGTSSSKELFIVCTDTDGEVQWAKKIDFIDTSEDGILHSIHATDDGIVLAGSVYNPSGSSGHGGNVFLLMLDYDAALQWAVQYELKSDQYYYTGKTDILEVVGNNLYVLGYISNVETGDDHGILLKALISENGLLPNDCSSIPNVNLIAESEISYSTTLDDIDYEGFEDLSPTFPGASLELYEELCSAEIVVDTFCFGETYLLPDGTVVDAAGTYTVVDALTGLEVIYYLTELSIEVTEIFIALCEDESLLLPDGTLYADPEPGLYSVIIPSVFGCDSVIEVNLTEVFPAYNIFVEADICAGETFILPDGSMAAVEGVYTSVLTSIDGCDSTVITNLLVYPFYLWVDTVVVCEGDEYVLPDGTVLTSTGYYETSYTTIYGCDSTMAVDFTVSPAFLVNQPVEICLGETYTLPDGIEVSEPGSYPFTFLTENNCDSVVTFELSVVQQENNALTLGDSIQCLNYYPLTLSGTPEGVTLVWSDNSMGNSLVVNSPGLYYGIYEGLCYSDTLWVEVITCGLIWIPNAFSPNQDGLNDFFSVITNQNIASFQLSVYNRWGEKIFESNSSDLAWDGKWQGIDQEIGSYVYVLKYSLPENPKQIQIQSGSVTLIR